MGLHHHLADNLPDREPDENRGGEERKDAISVFGIREFGRHGRLGQIHRRTRRAREHPDDQQDPEFSRVGCGHVQQLQHGDTDRTAEHDRPTTDTVKEPTGDGPNQQHADGEHAERQADVSLRTAEFLLDETRQHRKGEPTDAEVERRRRENGEHPRGVDTIDHAGGRHRPHGTGQTATARHPQPPTMPEWPTPASPPAHSRRRCRIDCGVGFSAWSVGS